MNNLKTVIDRLFSEAPKLTDGKGVPDLSQAPALQCHVLLRGQVQPLYGSLSTTEEGSLRMLTPSRVQHEGEAPKAILLEQFFDYEDVVAVMVEREVKATPGSRIITS